MRAAVNTTVMATESGLEGGRRRGRGSSTTWRPSFKQIAGLVMTTTRGGRARSSCSTKQQSTAVEQVNLAIANVSQAARETEASSTQTLQTSSELTTISNELVRLIQAGPAA